jgi:hypothetical protein
MSTRANIIIKETFPSYKKLFFYRHSDGYPEGTLPTLNKFLDLVKSGKIRDNISQSAGWLVLLGAIEYQSLPNGLFEQTNKKPYERETDALIEDLIPADWKCGAYEPTTGIHGDIEYLYEINLTDKTLTIKKRIYRHNNDFNREPEFVVIDK